MSSKVLIDVEDKFYKVADIRDIKIASGVTGANKENIITFNEFENETIANKVVIVLVRRISTNEKHWCYMTNNKDNYIGFYDYALGRLFDYKKLTNLLFGDFGDIEIVKEV